MKKVISLTMALAMSAMTLAGCGGGSGSTGSAGSGSAGASGDTVKVGWIGSLTGDQAVWGKCESQTVEMFFEELNADGGLLGKKVEVVKYDTRGDGQEAVNAVKRLTSQDKVIGIIGPNASGQAISISAVLEESKVPDIATVATNTKVTVGDDGKVKPYNFRVCFIDPYQGAVAAGYAYDQLKVKSAAVLYDMGDDYSQGLTQYFKESFEKKGGKIVADEAYKSGDVDFRAQLTKIKEANPEVIFMPFPYKEVALATKQARELGIKSTFMGGDTWPSEELFNMAKDAVEGSYIVNHIDYNDPAVAELKNKYKEKFEKDAEINTYLSWDACAMFVDAVKKAGDFDTVKIKDALETTDIQGITGHIVIGKDTHNPENKDAAIIQIKDGKYEFKQRYKPE